MQEERGHVTKLGDQVRFQASDVFLPSPGEPANNAADETELEGTVVDFSDAGYKARHFAVIQVVKIRSFVVPVDKLEVIEGSEGKNQS